MSRRARIEERELIDACVTAFTEVIEKGNIPIIEVKKLTHVIADIMTYPPLHEYLVTRERHRMEAKSCPYFREEQKGCGFHGDSCSYPDAGECPWGFKVTLPTPERKGRKK